LLVIVNWPLAEPTVVGTNCSVMFADWPGFSVTGVVPLVMEKPVPETVAALTVTAAVPVDVRVIVWVVAEFTITLPNAMLVALMLSVGTAAFNCSENPIEVPPVAAVIVTDCAVLTAVTVAENATLVAAAGTVTEAGTTTALLLLERLTLDPPVGADPESVTVHASVPAPVIDELLQ